MSEADESSESTTQYPMWKVEDLTIHPKNAEVYGDEKDDDVSDLVSDMLTGGFDRSNPVTVKTDGTVVKGNRRVRAARQVGIEEIPACEREYDSFADEMWDLVTDNITHRERTDVDKWREVQVLKPIIESRNEETRLSNLKQNEESRSGQLTTSGGGKTREELGDMAGMSGRTYSRLDKVMEAAGESVEVFETDGGAEADTVDINVPEEVREVAKEQVEKIRAENQSINGAHVEVKDAIEEHEREERREEDAKAQQSAVESVRDSWDVEVGQIWEVPSSNTEDPHRIVCGDALDPAVLDQALDGVTPDIAYADPPYGIDESANRGEGSETGFMTSYEFPSIEGDETVETAVASYERLADLEIPLIILWGAKHYAEHLPSSAGWIVWDKRDGMDSDDYSDAELAWTNQDRATRVFRHQWRGAIKASERDDRRLHPTQKPIALADYVLTEYADSTESVLDPFLGSGSTAVSADRTGTTCYGIECVPDYVAVTLERLAEEGRSPELRGEIQ